MCGSLLSSIFIILTSICFSFRLRSDWKKTAKLECFSNFVYKTVVEKAWNPAIPLFLFKYCWMNCLQHCLIVLNNKSNIETIKFNNKFCSKRFHYIWFIILNNVRLTGAKQSAAWTSNANFRSELCPFSEFSKRLIYQSYHLIQPSCFQDWFVRHP